MRSATRVMVSTFGVLAGLAGIEHGIGEIVQGNVAPVGIVIASWPGSELFRHLGGEPALTIIPNLLISGILAVLFSLVFLVWATMFVQRKNGGLVLILLSIVMLLVGGGFGPPLLGIIIGAAGTRINAPLTWWRTHLPTGLRHFLALLWPWSFGASLIAWLLMLPGTLILVFFGVSEPIFTLVSILIPLMFGLLFLAIITGFAYDSQQQISPQQELAVS